MLIWASVLLVTGVWAVWRFKFQPFERLWSVAPTPVRGCIAILFVLGIPIYIKMFAMPYARLRRNSRTKAQYILDDFRQFLGQQLPQHEKEITAIKVKISAQFPATIVGPQGSENRMQLEAAHERQRAIRDRWKAAQREIENLFMEVGLEGVADSVITGQLNDVRKQVEGVLELVRTKTQDQCFNFAGASDFDAAWAKHCEGKTGGVPSRNTS